MRLRFVQDIVAGRAYCRWQLRALAGAAGRTGDLQLMQPRIQVITLAVEDLERSLAFYRTMGLESPGIIGTEFVGDDEHPGGAASCSSSRVA
jgi:hypothetical protein